MIRYRFKTEQEFIDEYGQNWRNPIRYINGCSRTGYYFNPDMDYLLGTELTDYVDEGLYIRIIGSCWMITDDMLIEIKKPNYNEKKVLVYD